MGASAPIDSARSDGEMVTWLIAVRNGMPYLPATLASIAAQTYPHWRVLVWDNGSSDGTAEELRRWIPARLTGRVISDRPCVYLGDSRRELVLAAETELCAWIDADDLAVPTRLAQQVAFLLAHPEVAAVGGQMELLAEHGAVRPARNSLPLDHHNILNHLIANSPLAQPSVLFRRSAVLQAGNYANVGSINVEDYDLWLRLARTHQLANLPGVMLQYRVHPGSTTVQATRAGLLTQAADECFIRHGPALFGCTAEEAALLRNRASPFAWPVLVRMCQYLERTQGVPTRERLRMRSFVDSAQQLVGRRDFRTRLALALREPTLRQRFRQTAVILPSILKSFLARPRS
jgi:hypothetical protein